MRSTLGLMLAVSFVVRWTVDTQVSCPKDSKLTHCSETQTVGEVFDKKDSADVFARVLRVVGAQGVKLEEVKTRKK